MKYILKKEFIAPVIIILVAFVLIALSKKILRKVFNIKSNKVNEGKAKTIINLIGNIIRVVIVLIALIAILQVYGIDTGTFIASFGIVGLVVGLALQDLLKDLISGMSIIFEGQYAIGDWVSINGFKGEVIPSSLRVTKLKAYTGEIKIIANRNITELINYSANKANLIIDVDVAYESDVDHVRKVLDSLCESMKEKCNLGDISCLGIQELSSSSIRFRLVASTPYLEQFNLDRSIKKEIVKTFAKNNITIPYQQVVVHNGQRV